MIVSNGGKTYLYLVKQASFLFFPLPHSLLRLFCSRPILALPDFVQLLRERLLRKLVSARKFFSLLSIRAIFKVYTSWIFHWRVGRFAAYRFSRHATLLKKLRWRPNNCNRNNMLTSLHLLSFSFLCLNFLFSTFLGRVFFEWVTEDLPLSSNQLP